MAGARSRSFRAERRKAHREESLLSSPTGQISRPGRQGFLAFGLGMTSSRYPSLVTRYPLPANGIVTPYLALIAFAAAVARML